MRRFLKRLLFLAATLGLGALAYSLMRTEGERVLRPVSGGGGGEPPGPKPVEGEPPRCAGTTRSGSRCTREAQPGSDFCWQHQ